ncbi:hypothetical protein [Kibdelosporangium phytohabitans]|uniref:Secreted protein n=1 Tax=Kibdelosporangium phytohabitans TaxID=860235 RepID=A0A0N9IBQ4_9PSEU|nr:hypothetical protein [Kibdelosporangium phytohabitans]ALG11922.1 hypothetical protein AOZ06_38170 [Kibdelosporangium phytohabitans]MBE1463374.1 hypothetical protein [Kibdelosporangium phytohabitans]
MKAGKLLAPVVSAVAALFILAPAVNAGTQGIYEWEFGGYYTTEPECHAAASREAHTHRCYFSERVNAWALYNGYYT